MPNIFHLLPIDQIIKNHPTLYRYFKFSDRDLKALYEPYLWFSTLDSFNDAFEGHLALEMADDFIHHAVYIEDFMFPPFPATPERLQLEDDHRNNPKQVYERFFERYKTKFIQEIANAKNKGFCCFLSGLDNGNLTDHQEMTMWGHYAAGMRGFRVAYDTKILLGSIDDADAYPMRYELAPPSVDVARWLNDCTKQINSPRLRAAQEEHMFQVKHKSWEFEGELRLRLSEPGARAYDPRAIRRVDFGRKMQQSDRALIRHVLDRHRTPIEYYSADLSEKSFSISYRYLP
jgi:hypothetical protein